MQISPAVPIPDPIPNLVPNLALNLVPDPTPYSALNPTLPSLIQEHDFRLHFLEIYDEYGETVRNPLHKWPYLP